MDWTPIIDQLIDLLLPTLATVLTGVFTYIGTKIKAAYEQKINSETAQTVVNNVVRCIQQTYVDLDGPAKLQKAIEDTSTILKGKGINLTETEIIMLIESAVYGLKQGVKTDDKKALPEVTE